MISQVVVYANWTVENGKMFKRYCLKYKASNLRVDWFMYAVMATFPNSSTIGAKVLQPDFPPELQLTSIYSRV